MDNEIDRKIDVTAILFILVENRQQTYDWTLIGSGANGLGIQECESDAWFTASDVYKRQDKTGELVLSLGNILDI